MSSEDSSKSAEKTGFEENNNNAADIDLDATDQQLRESSEESQRSRKNSGSGTSRHASEVDSVETYKSDDPYSEFKLHFLVVFDKSGKTFVSKPISPKYTAKDLDIVALKKTVLELKTKLTEDEMEFFRSTNSENDEWQTMYSLDGFYISVLFQKEGEQIALGSRLNLFWVGLV